MIKRYTFLTPSFYFVLENATAMVGGLEKCIAVFFNPETKNIEVLNYEKELKHLTIKETSFIEKLRKDKKMPTWIQAEQVPFEISTEEKKQLTFYDEEKSSVLEMRFRNTADGNYDVLYFYFKNSIANFKLSSNDEVLEVKVKEVIQHLLYNQVGLILKSNSGNKEIHQKIANTYNDSHLQAKINQLEKERFEQAKSAYTYILNKITKNEEVELVLSDAAITKLRESSLSPEMVEGVLQDTLEIILNKYNPTDFYEISVSDLLIENISLKSSLSIREEKLSKTKLFLDKYEAAAKIVLAKNEKITGLNIGEQCYPKVTPAAISDVLKKHQKKIQVLFQQYPD